MIRFQIHSSSFLFGCAALVFLTLPMAAFAQGADVQTTPTAPTGTTAQPVVVDAQTPPSGNLQGAGQQGQSTGGQETGAPQDAGAGSSAVPSLMETLNKALPSLAGNAQKSPQDSKAVLPTDIPGLDLPADEGSGGGAGGQPTPEQAAAEMRSASFEAMMSGMLPLNPPEIRDAFGRMDENQKAVEEPLAYPKPEIAFTTISLDPGVPPLTFKLATGHVTTVSFLDITGQPWPIKDMTWAGNFDVKSATQNNDEKFPMYPNIMRIIPMSEYAYGNMSVRLVGLQTPLTFTLRTGRDRVQYRLDLRVPQNGPLAVPPVINNGANMGLTAGDQILTRIMEGTPPPAAVKMDVKGVDGRTTAYRVNGQTYVRTPYTLLSPAWTGSVRSADGMNVYAMADAPVLLLSDRGEMVRAELYEQHKEETP